MRKIVLYCTSILLSLLSVSIIMAQEIKATLGYSIKHKSLVVSIKLENKSDHPLFLVCPANDLILKDYVPLMVNYAFYSESQKTMRPDAKAFIRSVKIQSTVMDTISLYLPITHERFQVNSENDTIMDIFERLDKLEMAYQSVTTNNDIPVPPNDLLQSCCIDDDLYNLLQISSTGDMANDCMICGQVVLLNPNEEKVFRIDLSYLLLQKATYKILFDFTTNRNIKKETKFLKALGYNRFKGRITSNFIYIVSK